MIRFEVPETIITDYKFSKATLKAKKIPESHLKSLVQITFVWPAGSYGKRLFVCGLGAKNLNGWRPVFGGETSVDELREHFVGSLSFGQFNPVKDDDKKADKFPEIKEPGEKKAKVKAPEVKKTAIKDVETKKTETEVSSASKKTLVKETVVKTPEVKKPEAEEVKK
jgi:hypothetical protein